MIIKRFIVFEEEDNGDYHYIIMDLRKKNIPFTANSTYLGEADSYDEAKRIVLDRNLDRMLGLI